MAIRQSRKGNLVDLSDYQENLYNSMINVANLEATDTDTGGSSTGAAGSTGPLVDLSAFGLTGTAEYLLAKLIREGEAKFGIVPFTEEKKEFSGDKPGKGPARHPLLSKSQRFDGVDPKLNALPTENSEAKREFDLRLQHQLQLKSENKLQNSSAPTFKPAGL